ncbi:MAG: hypothetical protein AAF567_00675 [Actinomycetota bacterium]
MGLIARHLEGLGWPTTSLSSAWSITASANPPRATFLNYPLGHTAGRPNQLDEQTDIVAAALGLLHSAERPGEIAPLDLEWPDPWRAGARALSDKRTERFDTPQYQFPEDEVRVGA